MVNDLYINIAIFLSTKDMFSLSYTCKEVQMYLMESKYNMINHQMKLKKNIKNLKFITELPYKIYNLKLNKNLRDDDFVYLEGINTLNM